MAHAAFPLATGVSSPTLSDRGARRLARVTRTIAGSAALAVVTAMVLTHIASDSRALEASARSAEAAHRLLVDEVTTTQRMTAIAADRADDRGIVIADQLVALDSRAGFLP